MSALEEPIRGHAGIGAYWQEKVVQGRGHIQFILLQTYIDGATGIAEWDVAFDDRVQRQRKHLREVAILAFVDGKIASLREYWASEVLGPLRRRGGTHRSPPLSPIRADRGPYRDPRCRDRGGAGGGGRGLLGHRGVKAAHGSERLPAGRSSRRPRRAEVFDTEGSA
jgi:hypothetical protein